MLAVRRRQQIVPTSVAEATLEGMQVAVKRRLRELGTPLGREQHVELEEAAVMEPPRVQVREARCNVGGDREQTVGPRELNVWRRLV